MAMRQTQAEIKAIEAELQSIRADKSRRSVTLLEPHANRAVQPTATVTSIISPTISSTISSTIAPTISSTITRTVPDPAFVDPSQPSSDRSPTRRSSQPSRQSQANPQPTQRSEAPPARRKPQPEPSVKSQRSVECFPLPPVRPPLQAAVQAMDESEYLAAYLSANALTNSSANSSARLNRSRMQLLLTEKAQQINTLSQQQELIIQELITLSDQFEQVLEDASDLESDPICEYVGTEIPYVEQDDHGTLLLTTRSIDWRTVESPQRRRSARRRSTSILGWLLQQTGRLALMGIGVVGAIGRLFSGLIGHLTSALIRSLLQLTGSLFGIAITLPRLLKPLLSLLQPARPQSYRGSGRRTISRPARRSASQSGEASAIELSETQVSLKSIALYLVGAAALRILLDWIVVLHPTLWLPSVLVMITPALFTVYRSTLTPHVGFAWGYRLFAIMIGLLLGGRL